MPEQADKGQTAILVSLDCLSPSYADSTQELVRLADSAGLSIGAVVGGKRQKPDPAYFAGTGKVDEIGESVHLHQADVVIFNHELTPAQERNLERRLQCRVLDRVSLILDIFAQRAQSSTGKLQVELAQLEHLSTRLVRGWSHLERQKGGIGLRGPGETQLETDRRLIGRRVKVLRDRLARLERQRASQRRRRSRSGTFAVSLVGYTNAGKSTLFNALTHAGSYTADQLFATLDTTTRRLFLPGCGSLTLSDTVGFIADLPHTLVEAFHATLEETIEADLLLHVVDASHPNRERHIEAVNAVLAEIGAHHVPQILVMNKCDISNAVARAVSDEYGKIAQLFISAKTGAGLDNLRAALCQAMRSEAGTLSRQAEPLCTY
jgi:GTPase